MNRIRYGDAINLLVIVKGHPFQRDAFAAVFEEMVGVSVSFLDQPAATHLITPETVRAFDALVFYDMPGLDFLAQMPDRPRYVEPPEQYRRALLEILAEGKGVVALHHAIAGWPTWDEYGELLGGRFLYLDRPGAIVPGSGYRHEVEYEVELASPGHPVLKGLPETFSLVDELYLYDVFEADVTPLLRARRSFSSDDFYSGELAVSYGRMNDNTGWSRPDGSPLIAWAKPALNSPLVYLQPGDGPSVYNAPEYRRLVRNAIDWVMSPEAHAWARASQASAADR